MAAVSRKLAVILSVNNAGFNKGMKQSAAAYEHFGRVVHQSSGRLNAVTSASGRTRAGIQQLLFAVDDASSVFGTAGFAGAVRAAGNNITQFGVLMGGTTGLVAGLALSIGGQLVARMMEAKGATKEANMELESFKATLDSLQAANERAVAIEGVTSAGEAKGRLQTLDAQIEASRRTVEQLGAKAGQLHQERMNLFTRLVNPITGKHSFELQGDKKDLASQIAGERNAVLEKQQDITIKLRDMEEDRAILAEKTKALSEAEAKVRGEQALMEQRNEYATQVILEQNRHIAEAKKQQEQAQQDALRLARQQFEAEERFAKQQEKMQPDLAGARQAIQGTAAVASGTREAFSATQRFIKGNVLDDERRKQTDLLGRIEQNTRNSPLRIARVR